MGPDVVASLSIGWIALAAIAILALGIAAGWFTARARARRKAALGELGRAWSPAALLDALPQAALIVNSDGQIAARNTRAAQVLKSLGRDDGLPLAVDAAVGRVVRARAAETLEISAPGKPIRRLQVAVAPLRSDGSASDDVLVLFTDPGAMSNRVEVYQRLISMIAHELRTPMTAIMGHVDILNSCRMDEEALWRRSLGFVAGEAERLSRLVEDLLSLSRLDLMPLHIQSMSVRAAAEEALSSLFEASQQHGVTLVLQAPGELPRVQADPDRIRQVFLNLLDNAIKYAPGGTVTVQLTLDGETIRVEVGDTGPGISAEDLPHIFEPLCRGGRATPGSSGTGLGLTIVRTILDQHSAPISVHSLPNQGTAFRFSLPVAR